MPEQPASKRGSGAAVSARGRVARPARHYGKDDAGPTCGVCGTPMVKQLSNEGILEHPTCDPDMHVLLKVSAQAQAMKEAGTL